MSREPGAWQEFRGRSNQWAGDATAIVYGTALVVPAAEKIEVELLACELVQYCGTSGVVDVLDLVRLEEAASSASLVNRGQSVALAERKRGQPPGQKSKAFLANCNASDGAAQTTIPVAGVVERVSSLFTDGLPTAVGQRHHFPEQFPCKGLMLQQGLLAAVRTTALHAATNILMVNWHWREREL